MYPDRRFFKRKWIQRLIVWGGLIIAWELFAIRVGPLALPRFSEIVMSMVASLFNGDLLTLLGSIRQMFAGLFLAVVIGIALGILMGTSPLIDAVIGLYARALFVTSLEALLPFLIIIFGTSFNFRVAVVFLFALFHIMFLTAGGVRSVGRDLLEMAAAFCTPRRKLIIAVVIPAILPYILAGCRLGLGAAFKGMIIAELWIIVDTGKILVELGVERRLPEFFAFAAWIIIFSIGLTRLLLAVERRLAPWSSPTITLQWN
jgi:ABC-type nitrate/sulfonate/bicarbonate transport system permease component